MQDQEAQFNAIFDEADKRKKGLLNRNEYTAFCDSYAKKFEETGELCYKRTVEENTAMFNALNKIHPDVSGISKGDIREGFMFQQYFIKSGLNPLTKEIRFELMLLAD